MTAASNSRVRDERQDFNQLSKMHIPEQIHQHIVSETGPKHKGRTLNVVILLVPGTFYYQQRGCQSPFTTRVGDAAILHKWHLQCGGPNSRIPGRLDAPRLPKTLANDWKEENREGRGCA